MGGCAGCGPGCPEGAEEALDLKVIFDRPSCQQRCGLWNQASSGRELFRLDGLEDASTSGILGNKKGCLRLSELRILWSDSTPSSSGPWSLNRLWRSTRNGCDTSARQLVSIGYSCVEDVRLQVREDNQVLSIAARTDRDSLTCFEFICSEDPLALKRACAAIDSAMQAYSCASRYLQCTLRHRDLFEHGGCTPELQMLPMEQVVYAWEGILNYGTKGTEDLVGRLTLTDCRVVWALDKDRATYNVSVPHRAYVASLTESSAYGLCLVLTVTQNFLIDFTHWSGVRLGFGLPQTTLFEARYAARPQYGVADYMANRQRYQVDARVRMLESISHWDVVSEDPLPAHELEGQLAGEVVECAICLEQVCNFPPQAYLLATGRLGRACSHFFHMSCLRGLAQKRCPVCRVSFSEARQLPDIRSSPGAWFDAMDSNRTGNLSKDEVVCALAVVLPIDRDKLEALLGQPSDGPRAGTDAEGSLWRQWDKTGRGSITRAEFEDPTGGLLVWILARLKLVHRREQEPPELLAAITPELMGEWFDFWDWGQVGFLTQAQITRACVKEHEGLLDPSHVRTLVQKVWAKFTSPLGADRSHVREGGIGEEPAPAEPDEQQSPGCMESCEEQAPDPINLRHGICGRSDFLGAGGLGAQLQELLKEAVDRQYEVSPASQLEASSKLAAEEAPLGVPTGAAPPQRCQQAQSAAERPDSR